MGVLFGKKHFLSGKSFFGHHFGDGDRIDVESGGSAGHVHERNANADANANGRCCGADAFAARGVGNGVGAGVRAPA